MRKISRIPFWGPTRLNFHRRTFGTLGPTAGGGSGVSCCLSQILSRFNLGIRLRAESGCCGCSEGRPSSEHPDSGVGIFVKPWASYSKSMLEASYLFF